MPGPVLHLGATVLCCHGGQATPMTPFPRVTVGGQPVVTLSNSWLVSGCGNVPACVSASFVSAAARVSAGGAPVLLQDSGSVCTPTGTPTIATTVQPRVIGS